MATFLIEAQVTLRGAIMEIEAESVEEARIIAAESPDYDWNGAEMCDWSITRIREQRPAEESAPAPGIPS